MLMQKLGNNWLNLFILPKWSCHQQSAICCDSLCVSSNITRFLLCVWSVHLCEDNHSAPSAINKHFLNISVYTPFADYQWLEGIRTGGLPTKSLITWTVWMISLTKKHHIFVNYAVCVCRCLWEYLRMPEQVRHWQRETDRQRTLFTVCASGRDD